MPTVGRHVKAYPPAAGTYRLRRTRVADAASTAFWVDPAEQLTALFFTQLRPSSTYPLRPQLRQLVYQALTDPPPR